MLRVRVQDIIAITGDPAWIQLYPTIPSSLRALQAIVARDCYFVLIAR
jgi:hypothetical protein